VTARDDLAGNFTAARRGRGRASTYQITDKTRFVVGGSWRDVSIGTVVQVRWHRAGSQRVAAGARAPQGEAATTEVLEVRLTS
jgi:hypothetical protein